VYDYYCISYEARERARRREHEGACERIARAARWSRRSRRRLRLIDALDERLHLYRDRLASGI
jgi:hypothetical protein